MSHLPEPLVPDNDMQDFRQCEPRCTILPPHSQHTPCGFPGCGKISTGKWAEPVFTVEVRGISPSWGGLENRTTDLTICGSCFEWLSQLASDAYKREEDAAVALLTPEE